MTPGEELFGSGSIFIFYAFSLFPGFFFGVLIRVRPYRHLNHYSPVKTPNNHDTPMF